MATPGKASKKEQRRQIPSKTSFSSPFTSCWAPLPQDDMNFILNTLKDKLSSTGLEKKEEKKEEKGFRPWRRKKKNQNPGTEEVLLQESSSGRTGRTGRTGRSGWTDAAARRQLAIGINEATKALERNQLRLLLVCKSVKPQHMSNHLVALSASRGVPACQVPRLSLHLAAHLGLHSVLALGFKLSSHGDAFTDTVEAITPRVPPLELSWLQGGGKTPGGKTPGGKTPGGKTPGGNTPGGNTPGGNTPGGKTPGGKTPGGKTPGDKTPGDKTPGGNTPGGKTPGGNTPGGNTPGGNTPGDTPGSGDTPAGGVSVEGESCEARGQKRKLECEPEESPSCSLQPLRVKKIVANPAKKRKVKPKKQKVK